MNEFRKTYIVVGLVAKRLHFQKGMGDPRGAREVFGKETADIYRFWMCMHQKKLGYCFRAFGGYDIQSGDQPAGMLDRG